MQNGLGQAERAELLERFSKALTGQHFSIPVDMITPPNEHDDGIENNSDVPIECFYDDTSGRKIMVYDGEHRFWTHRKSGKEFINVIKVRNPFREASDA